MISFRTKELLIPHHPTQDKNISKLSTEKNREKKDQGKQQGSSLAFRGFNTVKAAKMPVKDITRLNENKIVLKSSRENSLEVKSRQLGASIEMAKKLLAPKGATTHR